MKKLTLLLISIVISLCLLSQTPQAFKYQAVVRNDLGEVINNQTVSFRITIHDSIANGPVHYQETHVVMTDAYGHANLEIGWGTPIIGAFTDVDWAGDDKFLEVEFDHLGGAAWISMGTIQLLAVPYALYSESTGDSTRWRKNIDDLYYLNGKVGIGTTSPSVRLDLRSSVTDDHGRLWLGNSDLSHYLRFFSGRQNAYPVILWNESDALRFGTSLNSFTEYMRITNKGKVGIGTISPDPSAKLDVSSDSLGFLLPRMPVTDIVAIDNPANGLMVFNTTDSKLYIYIELFGEWKQMSYGINSISESCGLPITDSRDQKTYNTVQIGTQCWMAENLNVGTRIDSTLDQSNDGFIEKYCYRDVEDSCDVYGGLYMWDEMMEYSTVSATKGICPNGWHVPTDYEWEMLEGLVDSQYPIGDPEWDILDYRGFDAGGNIKEPGFLHWISPNEGATNSSGFTALGGGVSLLDGSYFGIGELAGFWSSDQVTSINAWSRALNYNFMTIGKGYQDKDASMSLRCIKD